MHIKMKFSIFIVILFGLFCGQFCDETVNESEISSPHETRENVENEEKQLPDGNDNTDQEISNRKQN